MLRAVLCILIVWLAVVVPEVAGDTCKRYIVNGCSIPGDLPFVYKDRFTAACNRHDVCYYCGKSRGVSRGTCDLDFFFNMMKTCRWHTFYCQSTAKVYYLAVRAGGSNGYNKPAQWWCGQSWVSGCMK
ncbi:conodipine-P3-like [Gigantopelta aegis]|uniref:conodipine-P3-like n=1 Tax=Gigantopelta aegis TaxID=1735272 RepID=UPI001B88DA5D|nr:conodipine-P3-like [Gigantopelta aegis]